MRSYFKEVVQNFELKRVGGGPKGHQFAPIFFIIISIMVVFLYMIPNKKNRSFNIEPLNQNPLVSIRASKQDSTPLYFNDIFFMRENVF